VLFDESISWCFLITLIESGQETSCFSIIMNFITLHAVKINETGQKLAVLLAYYLPFDKKAFRHIGRRRISSIRSENICKKIAHRRTYILKKSGRMPSEFNLLIMHVGEKKVQLLVHLDSSNLKGFSTLLGPGTTLCCVAGSISLVNVHPFKPSGP
jgi:hypothetical protein